MTLKKIVKRDGRKNKFNQTKITNAIEAAGQDTKEFGFDTAEKLSDEVLKNLNEIQEEKEKLVTVEEIQDTVEDVLMRNGFARTAKSYILYRKEHQELREKRKEILSGKTTDLPFSLNSLEVLAGRYLRKDIETGEILEKPEDLFKRVAKAIAGVEGEYGKDQSQIEEYEEKFYDVMTNFEFLPAGRTLANAGAETKVVSNCIVLDIKDSLDGIYTTLRDATLLQQAGSGVGFPFQSIRPAGELAKRTQGKASGPVSFLEVYDKAFGVVQQRGRHGANMAVMRVDHPDILDFIHSKDVEGKLENFNISVAVTDEFLEKIEEDSDEPWKCEFGGKEMLPRRITRDENGVITNVQESKITPSEILEEMTKAAWANGEPGVIFIDEVNRDNPLPGLGKIKACNPCGEQFLHSGDVCNLGSINLDEFVEEGKIQWDRLREVIKIATRMLDNVIDITEFPVERVNNVFRKNRRIGIGIMGFADMLLQMEVPYDSEKGREIAEEVMKFITEESHKVSQELAEEKGTFPNYESSIWSEKEIKMRNAATTTIAPTGSISMVSEVSSGLEPNFAFSYSKSQVMDGKKFQYTNPYLEKKLREENIYSEELSDKITHSGSIQEVEEIPEHIKEVFVGAMDISPEDHIRMQAAFQERVDNSISKTINLPNDATEEDIREAILLAWKLNLKSFTVYREGSRESQVLSFDVDEETDREKSSVARGDNPTCEDCGV